ncbi:orotidine-5'-phosphate decarboxylase [Calidifontibacter indicus]|uniref:Orotidine 5'-phosphate decarboxylase n=1 Tax=Calidifontibacter indicus TaxID=419650 RepID=A0A3D9UNW8_9MICO|nr:orotidine-5'-phosphate decarboxylase [Calidifontibacter indicus]REF30976.1 orotidine-5'-phosphate decarboxylase [Calidifontibacter indicus]
MTDATTAATEGFGARLSAAMDEHGPLCVGIDPHAQLLRDWGLPVDASGLREFALRCVEAFGGQVAVVKPQSAFFEQFGSRGVAVLEETLDGLRDAGTLTLLDVKRGDVGSTMAGYAAAHLGPDAPVHADAITVSPFLGFGSLAPALDLAQDVGAGLFVLALTSNPEGHEVQHAVRPDGRTVARSIVDAVAELNADTPTDQRVGDIGLVVGATTGAAIAELDLAEALAACRGPLLAPGVGAQGGTVEDIADAFGAAARQVLPSASRSVLGAGPDTSALRKALQATAAHAARVLG